jgi:hypothetical protein
MPSTSELNDDSGHNRSFFDLNNLKTAHKHYLIYRDYYFNDIKVSLIADKYKCTESLVYKVLNDCSKAIKDGKDPFFVQTPLGRPSIVNPASPDCLASPDYLASPDLPALSIEEQRIIDYRLQHLSVHEIKVRLDAEGLNLSERSITSILRKHNFLKLKRRALKRVE